MITANKFSFSFPNKDLYYDISFNIEKGDSCAFIGSSGCGKSTLADIIMDPDRYMFDGELTIDEECKIGYVSQFYDHDKSKDISVFEYIAQPFIDIEKESEAICKEMETSLEYESLLEKYQEKLDEFQAIDGDNYENNINKKLGLANLMNQRDLSVLKLSGGEFKLIQVIKQMLLNPNLIIMDEPDAFLDFENLNALKNLINDHKGILLVITHSRYLLNHCFNKILHLENKELRQFDGRYIEYNYELLDGKIEMQELAFKDEEEIERNEVLIDRLRFIAENFDSSANGKSLKARMKIQERLEARRIQNPFINVQKPNIHLEAEDVMEDEIALAVDNLRISFNEEDDVLLENVSFEIKSTDKVAIIGPNGTGKTTLIREIQKNNNPCIKFSEGVTTSYLSQNQLETFPEDKTIFDIFFDIGFKTYDEITEYLDTFGFPKNKMNQTMGKLSGGEKTLLGLAKISHGKANFLILDEPTSHLDTYAQIALEEAILSYNGGLLLVSHDFYTISGAMDYLLIIDDKTVRKMQMRKFRKIIYARHFDKDYLELEQKKKAVETKIEMALSKNNYEQAKELLSELENVIEQM